MARTVVSGLVLAVATAVASGQQASLVDVNIEPQPLDKALNNWATQTGYQVLVPVDRGTQARTSPGVKGSYTPEGALKLLLARSDLSYQFVNARTVAIRPATAPPNPAAKPADPAQTDANHPLVLAQSHPREEQAVVTRDTENSGSQTGGRRDLEEVLVTGTHIRGTENQTAPLTVLNRQYIESTGVSTASRLVETLPQNFALANQSGVNLPGVSSPASQASTINLRGIGEGTTLILLNGHRMAPGFLGEAVDISALPVTALDRVEVLTDGASAIYGSDAVGGVVNFVLRTDFDGAETRLRNGWANGSNEQRASQTVGHSWGTGNALASVEYYHRDLLRASDRSWVPSTSLIGSLLPKENNISAMFSGQQRLSDSISVFGDALYSRRNSFNEGGLAMFQENNATHNPQIAGTAGLRWQSPTSWAIEATGTYASNKLEQAQNSELYALVFGDRTIHFNSKFRIKDAQLQTDGQLFDLPAGPVRLAAGAEWRSETFEYADFNQAGSVSPGLTGGADQTVRSVFAELSLPIVSRDRSLPGIQRLELSVAGRYDDYSGFGSSIDPRYGISWQPFTGFHVRGSYGTSYKAPALVDYNVGTNGANAFYLPDPASSTGVSHQLQLSGANPDNYRAQHSRSSSFGIDYSLPSAPALQVGLNYFDIKYRDRIADPPPGSQVIQDPAAYGPLIIRNPTLAQVNQFIALGALGQGLQAFDPDFNPDPNFDPSTIDVLLDLRRRNMSVVKTHGFDLSFNANVTVSGSELSFALNGTRLQELVRQVTATSEPSDAVGTIYNPPHWRARASSQWRYRGLLTSVFINYTDSYQDNRSTPSLPISSWTTVDLNLRYDFGKDGARSLSGLSVSANAQNLFDRAPPRAAISDTGYDMGFDPTNASPLGRLLAVELIKVW